MSGKSRGIPQDRRRFQPTQSLLRLATKCLELRHPFTSGKASRAIIAVAADHPVLCQELRNPSIVTRGECWISQPPDRGNAR